MGLQLEERNVALLGLVENKAASREDRRVYGHETRHARQLQHEADRLLVEIKCLTIGGKTNVCMYVHCLPPHKLRCRHVASKCVGRERRGPDADDPGRACATECHSYVPK